MSGLIDLRSDTVTKPGEGMRRAMARAEVGDDGFGDDPSAIRLEERMAEILGKEASLFMPSGTMANEVSINVFTSPGTEVIVEAGSHIFNYEVAGASCISGVQLKPVEGDRGLLSAELIRRSVRPAMLPLPRTSLICLENTHNGSGGRVHAYESMKEIRDLAADLDLPLYLDGARLFNAALASGIRASSYASLADAVMVCFSKGLGAPIGSILAGSEAFIREARRVRRMLGGGMRQVGVLAAAALYAIQNNIGRLEEDHENAKLLARLLMEDGGGLLVDPYPPETNIVMLRLDGAGFSAELLGEILRERGVLLVGLGPARMRAVTNLGVSGTQVKKAAETICSVVRELGSRAR